MNPFQSLLKPHMPAVFNPRVTPDPSESERLETKLQEATQQLNEKFGRAMAHRARRVAMQL